MTRLIPICLAALSVGACAASSVSTTSDSSIPPGRAPGATVDAPDATAPTQAVADEGISVVEVPALAQTEPETADSRKDQRICTREVRTGTHRAVRVCRTVAEIERMEQESKETFRDMHRSQRTQDLAEQTRKH